VFTLMRSIPVRQLLLQQAPALGASFVIAEAFYKFHSFSLECLAFLATWYVLDLALSLASAALRKAFNANA
jgi:hypothetical protein